MADQNKTDYTNSGFDRFTMQRKGVFKEAPPEKLEDEISAESPIVRTRMVEKSSAGKLIIDYNTGEISVNHGKKIISLGNIDGLGKWYGLRITDSLGNVIFSAEGKLQSGGIEDGAVTASKISVTQLDAVATQTGTLTVDESISVGGAVNGKVSVKDSSNNEKVLLDNTGLTINSGKITLKDSGETTIVDATGLVSIANFASDSLTSTNFRNTTTNSMTDLANTTLTFTLDREAKVFLTYTIRWQFINMETTDILTADIRLNVDGTNEIGGSGMSSPPKYTSSGFTTDSEYDNASYSIVKTLAAGSHTIKLQWLIGGGVGDDALQTDLTSIAYIVLGK